MHSVFYGPPVALLCALIVYLMAHCYWLDPVYIGLHGPIQWLSNGPLLYRGLMAPTVKWLPLGIHVYNSKSNPTQCTAVHE